MAQAEAAEPESGGAPACRVFPQSKFRLAFPLPQAAARTNSTRACKVSRLTNGAVRLKRIFEVQLETSEGEKQTQIRSGEKRWLGMVGLPRLSDWTQAIWICAADSRTARWHSLHGMDSAASGRTGRKAQCASGASASYVAARARRLNLTSAATSMDLKRHNNGSRLLAKALSRAYGRFSRSC